MSNNDLGNRLENFSFPLVKIETRPIIRRAQYCPSLPFIYATAKSKMVAVIWP